jgi:hypothetical protein
MGDKDVARAICGSWSISVASSFPKSRLRAQAIEYVDLEVQRVWRDFFLGSWWNKRNLLVRKPPSSQSGFVRIPLPRKAPSVIPSGGVVFRNDSEDKMVLYMYRYGTRYGLPFIVRYHQGVIINRIMLTTGSRPYLPGGDVMEHERFVVPKAIEIATYALRRLDNLNPMVRIRLQLFSAATREEIGGRVNEMLSNERASPPRIILKDPVTKQRRQYVGKLGQEGDLEYLEELKKAMGNREWYLVKAYRTLFAPKNLANPSSFFNRQARIRAYDLASEIERVLPDRFVRLGQIIIDVVPGS